MTRNKLRKNITFSYHSGIIMCEEGVDGELGLYLCKVSKPVIDSTPMRYGRKSVY